MRINTNTYLSHVADTCVYLYTHINIRTQIHPIAGFLADTCAEEGGSRYYQRSRERERKREREREIT